MSIKQIAAIVILTAAIALFFVAGPEDALKLLEGSKELIGTLPTEEITIVE